MKKRDDFSDAVKGRLAKRSGFMCAICGACTVASSKESERAVTNVGVAAHITAASAGGPRYNEILSRDERSGIANGIWLCQNHAKEVDDDTVTWTVGRLQEAKQRHEEETKSLLGVSQRVSGAAPLGRFREAMRQVVPREYAFLGVDAMSVPYRALLEPMLQDRQIADDATLGVLMCGSPPEEEPGPRWETPWTVFANADWLRWVLEGQSAGFRVGPRIPAEHIYGQVPAWPDSFLEFLTAILESGATFSWQRHEDGYLVMVQDHGRR